MACTDYEELSIVARDHALHPRNYGPLCAFDGHARITGPCGDTMEFWLAVHDHKAAAVAFITDGCGSSRACGSMATCLAEGGGLEEIMNLQPREILEALGGFPVQYAHCALLAVTVLRAACENYLAHQEAQSERTTSPRDAENLSEPAPEDEIKI